MKLQAIKKGALKACVFGAALLTFGAVQAYDPSPADEWVQYSGYTTLTTTGGDVTQCRTTLSGIVNVANGDVVILSVGASNQGEPEATVCANVFTGNLEWTATLSNLGSGVAGSVSDIAGYDPNLPMVFIPATNESCLGPIIGGAGNIDYPDTITSGVPTRIFLDTVFANGCQIQTIDEIGLELKV